MEKMILIMTSIQRDITETDLEHQMQAMKMILPEDFDPRIFRVSGHYSHQRGKVTTKYSLMRYDSE